MIEFLGETPLKRPILKRLSQSALRLVGFQGEGVTELLGILMAGLPKGLRLTARSRESFFGGDLALSQWSLVKSEK